MILRRSLCNINKCASIKGYTDVFSAHLCERWWTKTLQTLHWIANCNKCRIKTECNSLHSDHHLLAQAHAVALGGRGLIQGRPPDLCVIVAFCSLHQFLVVCGPLWWRGWCLQEVTAAWWQLLDPAGTDAASSVHLRKPTSVTCFLYSINAAVLLANISN